MSDVTAASLPQGTTFKPGDRVQFNTTGTDADESLNGTIVDPKAAEYSEYHPNWNSMIDLVSAAAEEGDLGPVFWLIPDPGTDVEYEEILKETGQAELPFYAFVTELTLLEV